MTRSLSPPYKFHEFLIALIISGDQSSSISALVPLDPAQSMDLDEELEPLYYLLGHESNVCALDSNFGLVASGSWDKTARVWKDGSLLYTLKGHSQAVWAVKIISESLVLTGSADQTIRLWENGKAKKVFKGHTDAVRGLALISDSVFVSCSNDASIRVWDLEADTPIQELYGHTSFVYSVAVIPSTGEIVSSGEDRSVRVWRDGETVQVITLPYISAWFVAVNPEDGDIAIAGSDSTIRIFSRDKARFASEEDRTHFKDLVASSGIGKDQVGTINKENLEGEEGLKSSGKKEGEVKMIRTSRNTVEAYQWSAGKWAKIGEVVGSAGSTSKKLFNGVEYDYVFDVDIRDGEPALKLPYNITENPYDAARKFLERNELPMSYLDNVARFLITNSEGVDLTTQAPAQDPYGTRYVPGGDQPSSSTPSSSSSSGNTEKSLKVVPVKTYVKLISYKPAPILKAIRTNNANQSAENRISEEEIKSIETGLSSTVITEQAAASLFEITTEVLESWNSKDTLPILDVLRVIIPSLRTFPPIVLIQHLLSSLDVGVPNHCLLAIRGLVNLFSSPNPGALKLIESASTQETIFEVVTQLAATTNPKPEARNLAISSLCYNFAVLSWKRGASQVASNKLIETFSELFPYLTDSESRYRILLAVGTLLLDAGDSGKKTVAKSLEKFSELPLDEDRFKVVISDIKQLI